MQSKTARAKAQAPAQTSLSTQSMVLAALFAAATAVLSYLRIPLPFSPVPVTGQTFGFMLAGILLGPRLGLTSIIVYILMGAVGLPVFSGGTAGFGVLLGPTGGYLWGGLLGTWIAGLISGPQGLQVPRSLAGAEDEEDEHDALLDEGEMETEKGYEPYVRAFVAAVVGGIVAVYALGVVQLSWVTGMGWREALLAGVIPFLIGDSLKAGAAAVMAVRLAHRVQDIHR